MKFICIYNAQSGLFHGVLDSFHKIASPKTYQCKLCALTHGLIGAKQQRKNFLKAFPYEIEFLHKNELDATYTTYQFPCILFENGKERDIVISAEQFQTIESLDDVIERLKLYSKSLYTE